jgi:nucleoside-diphosphate-sugar epimerase
LSAGDPAANLPIVAITGASGMLGHHLCQTLAGRRFEVRALVRDPDAFREAPAGTRVGRCDLPETIDESLVEGASVLLHCAYATRETDLAEARRVNEEGTRRVLDVARRAGVRTFGFVSTITARPDAPSYYARSKSALEQLLDPGRDLIIRPGLILARQGHGLFQQMRDVTRRTHLVPLFGGGRQPLQTVHVEDLCEGVARALERGLTGVLNIAEPEPMPLVDFMKLLVDRLGMRCLFLPLPFRPVLALVRGAEALRVPLPLRSESLLGLEALAHVPVSEDLRRLDLVVRSARESLADVV